MNHTEKENLKRNIDLIIKRSNSLNGELWEYMDENCSSKIEEALKNIDECIDICLNSKRSVKKFNDFS